MENESFDLLTSALFGAVGAVLMHFYIRSPLYTHFASRNFVNKMRAWGANSLHVIDLIIASLVGAVTATFLIEVDTIRGALISGICAIGFFRTVTDEDFQWSWRQRVELMMGMSEHEQLDDLALPEFSEPKPKK